MGNKETLLLDMSIILDLLGLNERKCYINYDEIEKAQKCYSMLTIYEMLDNTDKFNKDELTFRKNFENVKKITKNVITNFEIGIDDNVILNMENCSSMGLTSIRDAIFRQIKPIYRNFYNSIIISFVNFMFCGIVLFDSEKRMINQNNLDANTNKDLNDKMNQFTMWLDYYVVSDKKYGDIMTKRGIHSYFRKLTDRVLNYLIITHKSFIRCDFLGYVYSNKFLNKIKKMIEDDVELNKRISMTDMLQQVIDNLGPLSLGLSLEDMKEQMLNRLCQTVRFNMNNEIISKYFKIWIGTRYNLIEDKVRIENDVIDCLIGCTTLGENGDMVLPISSDKDFIRNCCMGESYRKYINFGLL